MKLCDSGVLDHRSVDISHKLSSKELIDILLGQPFFQDHVQAILEDGGFLRMLIRDFDDPMKRVSLLLRADPENEERCTVSYFLIGFLALLSPSHPVHSYCWI
jgi:hypothetical protein